MLAMACVAMASRAADSGQAGHLERITVHGASLEGNLSGDSPDRQVSVYGDIAVVILLWSQTATVPGDRDISGHFLITDIWHNSPQDWRVIERHSSRQEKAA